MPERAVLLRIMHFTSGVYVLGETAALGGLVLAVVEIFHYLGCGLQNGPSEI